MKKSNRHNAGMFALSVAALGVVFGDIGTSPLYAIKEIFSISNNILELNEANLLGILSQEKYQQFNESKFRNYSQLW